MRGAVFFSSGYGSILHYIYLNRNISCVLRLLFRNQSCDRKKQAVITVINTNSVRQP